MEENKVVQNAIQEIKSADETKLKEVIEAWFEKTRTDGMKIGAYYISAGVFGIIQKHLGKKSPSLRGYKRCIDDVLNVVTVQLQKENAQQNDLNEETKDDGTADV